MRNPVRRWARAALDAPAESWIGAAVAAGCALFVLLQLHPELLVADTTPAGGDMGAHVWGPAYLRDNLLPSFRLTGWTQDWYAGFPAFQFYMLPPALLIVLFDVVLPYGIAMKLVTVLGVVAMPVCAYAMGRLFRLPFPGPPLLAAATVPFLFDRSWTIYGGNIPSTLAGEYSFSISLSLALLFFGVLARALETGRHRGKATALLALVILCHAIPAFFALIGGAVIVLLRFDWRRIVFATPILGLGCLLTAFWSVPFVLRRGLLTDMGWERLVLYRDNLLPEDTRWVLVLALVGIVLSLAFWIRAGVALGVLAGIFALGFRFDALELVHIWNARLLPFFYLSLYLLAAVGVSEVVRSIAVIIDGRVEWRRRAVETMGAAGATLAVLVVVALPLHSLPFGEVDEDGTYRWAFLETRDNSFIDSWTEWNYSGYERKPLYAEYRGIVSEMQSIGELRGCGRAHWEYEGELDAYGTPMALMLLPFWTDGCIGSMEGLYFESSGTTPFHFLMAAETSLKPSNPVRSLPERPMEYSPLDLNRGVEHLQLMGVRYYMAFSPEALAMAADHEDLREIGGFAPWKVFEVADSDLVEPLEFQPAVLNGMEEDNPGWQRDAVAWFNDPAALDVVLAPDGPESWERVDRGERPVRREVRPTRVSNIDEDDMRISFDVDRIGTPVLVKTSYFPNWTVSGADGPYRVTPNLMVVVPTSEHVELTYGYTSVEYLGWGSSFGALLVLGLLLRRGPVTFPPPKRRRAASDAEDEGPDTREGRDGDGEGDGDDDDDDLEFGAPEPAPVPRPDPERLFWDPAPRDPDDFWKRSPRTREEPPLTWRPESAVPEGPAQPEQPTEGAEDPPSDRGASGAPLLDPDRELGDDDPGPLGP